MVAWAGGQTIAWWQLDLETGEMVGVGENGAHDFITFTTMFMAGFLIILHLVWIVVLLWQLVTWLSIMYITWEYFGYKAQKGLIAAEGKGELQKIYQDALSKTKAYMQNIRPLVPSILW